MTGLGSGLVGDQIFKRFTAAARPGAYLRVVAPGEIRAGDRVVVEYRPDHDVTIGCPSGR